MSEVIKNRYAERTGKMLQDQRQFILLYPTYGTVGRTMAAIGRGRSTFYDWLKDEEFEAVYLEMKRDRTDEIVTRLLDFIHGRNDVKLSQQQIIACIFLLKAFEPETFSEKYQLQAVGSDHSKVTTIEISRPVEITEGGNSD